MTRPHTSLNDFPQMRTIQFHISRQLAFEREVGPSTFLRQITKTVEAIYSCIHEWSDYHSVSFCLLLPRICTVHNHTMSKHLHASFTDDANSVYCEFRDVNTQFYRFCLIRALFISWCLLVSDTKRSLNIIPQTKNLSIRLRKRPR